MARTGQIFAAGKIPNVNCKTRWKEREVFAVRLGLLLVVNGKYERWEIYKAETNWRFVVSGSEDVGNW